jgi:hypothetical protein
LQVGEPDSKKCKIEEGAVRPKVEDEAAGASDGSAGRKQSKGKSSKSKQPAADEPPRDYVHVRARRGQATDSHSLAERVSKFLLPFACCFTWSIWMNLCLSPKLSTLCLQIWFKIG